MMTKYDVTQFIARLKKAGIRFNLTKRGKLRYYPRKGKPGFCPITALALKERGMIFSMQEYEQASLALEDLELDPYMIMYASDNVGSRSICGEPIDVKAIMQQVKELRRRLMKLVIGDRHAYSATTRTRSGRSGEGA